MASHEQTIVAVSSAPGRAWRGIVRLSGPAAAEIAAALFEPIDLEPRRLSRVVLRDPPIPALAIFFAGPASYTGQDLLELQAPGHPALLERLVQGALEAGARLAEPGEFTFRAFLAGKLDLTQAEGVAATISAVSDGQLRAAAQLRTGRLAGLAGELVDALGTRLALVEAGIDFTDQDDVVPIASADLDAALEEIERRLAALLGRSRSWGDVQALPRVVLVGPPSSGKSTLFNALLGRERALVSVMPGTTRDVLAEPLVLQDPAGRRFEVMLTDIAGLDTPAALLDAQVQRAAREAIARADLLLCIGDASGLDGAATLKIRTMADLHDTGEPLHVSATTGLRMNALRQAIIDALGGAAASISGASLALQPRHEHDLQRALEAVRRARSLLVGQPDPDALAGVELVAATLREALDHLAALGGQMTPDDVIGRVFATFCVGK